MVGCEQSLSKIKTAKKKENRQGECRRWLDYHGDADTNFLSFDKKVRGGDHGMRRHRAEKHHNRHEKFKPEKYYVGHFCATNCRMICNVPIVAILYPDQRYLILIVAGRRRAPRLHWRGGGGGEDTQKLGQGGGEDTEKLPHQAASQLPHQTPRFPNRTTQHSELAPPSLLSSNPILPRLPKPFSYLSHGQPWLAALVLVILLVPAGQYHTLPLLLLSIVLSLVSPELKVVEVIF